MVVPPDSVDPKRSGLVLAAHGSDDEAGVNARIVELVEQVAALDEFGEVSAAFHQGEPRYSTVLDGMSADHITVVPVMMSDGYYATHVLPRELARNQRYASIVCDITSAVGVHPEMNLLVEGRLRYLLDRFQLDGRDTSLALIGHGTDRHRRSREAIDRIAASLKADGAWGDTLVGFLDEEPSVDTVMARASGASVVSIPLLIGAGSHATVDVPRRLGIPPQGHVTLPFSACVGGRAVVCDVPIGSDPGILDIIVELARPHAARAANICVTDGAA